MREALHQLTMALALPLAVTVVWVVRGNPTPVESATAYRAELAALPLPRSERLRAPREAIDWRRAPREAEEPITPRRRVTLPEPTPAQPVALAAADDSARDRGVFASPRGAAPELPPVPDPGPRAARAAHPLVATPPAVVPSSASALARVATSAADASEAPAESQPEPAAKPAPLPAETPASGARPIARAVDESVRASRAPAVAKLAVAANVATPGPAKLAAPAAAPAAHPTPTAIAAPAARPSASAVGPLPAISPARNTSSTRRYAAPAKAPQLRGELETIDEQWREYAAAAAPSPAVAQATRELDAAPDLLLGGGQRGRSLLDAVLPTAHAWAAPPELAPAKPAPIAALPSAPAWVPGLLDLPLQALAARFDDGAAVADRADFASERRYPPLQALFAIPEPVSSTLIGVGLAALAATRRRQPRG